MTIDQAIEIIKIAVWPVILILVYLTNISILIDITLKFEKELFEKVK